MAISLKGVLTAKDRSGGESPPAQSMRLTSDFDRQSPREIDPSARAKDELYGSFDPQATVWT